MAKQQVTQNQQTVSIYRETFYQKIVVNRSLTLMEYRILMLLLTELDGFPDWKRLSMDKPYTDPRNFRKLSKKAIANSLCITKSEAKNAIEGLLDKHIIEKGSSSTCVNGYRLLF